MAPHAGIVLKTGDGVMAPRRPCRAGRGLEMWCQGIGWFSARLKTGWKSGTRIYNSRRFCLIVI
jgi:hypothetical protein